MFWRFHRFKGILNKKSKGGAKNFGHVAKGGEKFLMLHLGGGEKFWILKFLESSGKIEGHIQYRIACINKVIRERCKDLWRMLPPPQPGNNEASLTNFSFRFISIEIVYRLSRIKVIYCMAT